MIRLLQVINLNCALLNITHYNEYHRHAYATVASFDLTLFDTIDVCTYVHTYVLYMMCKWTDTYLMSVYV